MTTSALCDICDRALVDGECPECSKPWDEALFGSGVVEVEEDDEPRTVH